MHYLWVGAVKSPLQGRLTAGPVALLVVYLLGIAIAPWRTVADVAREGEGLKTSATQADISLY